jgi:hypothetical protein
MGGENVLLPSGPVILAMIPTVICVPVTPTSVEPSLFAIDDAVALVVNADLGRRVPHAALRRSRPLASSALLRRCRTVITNPSWHQHSLLAGHLGRRDFWLAANT